jgi:hypothetical protein
MVVVAATKLRAGIAIGEVRRIFAVMKKWARRRAVVTSARLTPTLRDTGS